jgi:hypothetical protein
MIQEGFKKIETKTNFSMTYNGKTIVAGKIEDLLKKPGMPDALHEATIDVEGKDKKIDLRLSRSEYLSRYVVEGENELWVEGKSSLILDFMKKRERSYNFIFHKWYILFIPLALIFLTTQLGMAYATSALLFFIIFLFIGIYLNEKKFPYSTIIIKGKVRESALLTFAISVVSSLVAGVVIHLVFG